MDITLLELYNPFCKLSIIVKRTKDKKYKYCKQITPRRNMWIDEIYDDLDYIKKDLFGEMINGYEIKSNILGMDFIDATSSGFLDESTLNEVDSPQSSIS